MKRFALALTAIGVLASTPVFAQYSNLVYTSVTPCAVFDTRTNFGGTGALAAEEVRSFHVVGTTNNFTAQGGALPTGCGVPAFQSGTAVVRAVMINLEAIDPQGSGQIKAWATDKGEHLTGAVVNFQKLTPNMNNSNAVPVEVRQDTEGLDLSVRARGSAVHLKGTILGFYTEAPPASSGQTVLAGTGLASSVAGSNNTLSIANGGVGTTQIADGAVTTAKIGTLAVTSAELADGAVITSKILDLNVTGAKIADTTITAAKITSGTATAGQVLAADGAGNAVWGGALSFANNATIHTVDAGNICSVNGGTNNATSISLGQLNGAAAAGAVVLVTPNGGNTGLFPTGIPAVGVSFNPNAPASANTCAGNKWIIYTMDGSSLSLGQKYSVFGAR